MKYENYPDPNGLIVLSVFREAQALVDRATRHGLVVHIHHRPRQPLAMGNVETIIEVRVKRVQANETP